MNRFTALIIHPLVLSIIITVLLIIIMPSIFDKYSIEQLAKFEGFNKPFYFYDLDHDGYDEFINLGLEYENKNMPYVHINTDYHINHEYLHLKTVYLPRIWVDFPNRIFFHDFDNNKEKEIFILTQKNKSLYITGIAPLEGKIIFDKLISEVPYKDNGKDYSMSTLLFKDLNQDGFSEIIFSVMGGLYVDPRKVFTYDIRNDSIRIKNVAYAYIEVTDHSIANNQKDNQLITLSSSTPANYFDTTSNLFSDIYSYLMVLDQNMNFVFEPIKHGGLDLKSSVKAFFINDSEDNPNLYAYFMTYIPGKSNVLKKLNLKGEVLNTLDVGCGEASYIDIIGFNGKQKILVLDRNKKIIYLINPAKLKIVREIEDKRFINLTSDIIQSDIDRDGINELIFPDKNQQQIIITQANFKDNVVIDFPYTMNNKTYIKGINLESSDANLFIQSDGKTFFYKFSKNPNYYFKYPFYLLIYLIIALFFFIIFRIQKQILLKKHQQEKYLTELELLTIKNQIDPHFTFNAINTLSSIIFDRDRKSAHQFLVKLSSVIRNSLQHSRDIAVPLKDELEFVENYLHIQQFRHDFGFEYEVIMEGDIDQNIMIPKMIIQTFTENAVKHGLIPKKENGSLIIKIIPETDQLKIIIEDNGIGRKAAKEISKKSEHSTGKGLEIIDQIIDLYQKLKKVKVTYEFEDLYNDQAAGTCVIIRIPK